MSPSHPLTSLSTSLYSYQLSHTGQDYCSSEAQAMDIYNKDASVLLDRPLLPCTLLMLPVVTTHACSIVECTKFFKFCFPMQCNDYSLSRVHMNNGSDPCSVYAHTQKKKRDLSLSRNLDEITVYHFSLDKQLLLGFHMQKPQYDEACRSGGLRINFNHLGFLKRHKQDFAAEIACGIDFHEHAHIYQISTANTAWKLTCTNIEVRI